MWMWAAKAVAVLIPLIAENFQQTFAPLIVSLAVPLPAGAHGRKKSLRERDRPEIIRSHQQVVNEVFRICREAPLADAAIVNHHIDMSGDLKGAQRCVIHGFGLTEVDWKVRMKVVISSPTLC